MEKNTGVFVGLVAEEDGCNIALRVGEELVVLQPMQAAALADILGMLLVNMGAWVEDVADDEGDDKEKVH